jgi:hypothetical protein
MRGYNKRNGPDRRIRSSYGVIRSEPYDPNREEHEDELAEGESFTEDLYVKDTIH